MTESARETRDFDEWSLDMMAGEFGDPYRNLDRDAQDRELVDSLIGVRQ